MADYRDASAEPSAAPSKQALATMRELTGLAFIEGHGVSSRRAPIVPGADATVCCSAAPYNSSVSRPAAARASVGFMHEDDTSGRLGELLRYGKVESVDLASGKMVVRVGDILTQPVRWFHGASGATSSWSPPSVGEQVMLLAPEGDIAGAIALRGVHSNTNPPAGNTARNVTRYADQAVIAYDPENHALDVILPSGAVMQIASTGGVTLDVGDVALVISGNVTIDGDVAVTGTITADADVVAAGRSLKNHVHGQVQSGAAMSGKPV